MNVHSFVLMILERILEMTAKFNVVFFSVACMKISEKCRGFYEKHIFFNKKLIYLLEI